MLMAIVRCADPSVKDPTSWSSIPKPPHAWPLPEDATSHLRAAGPFSRFIHHWLRERQPVWLQEGVRKSALIATEILAASPPDLRATERLPTRWCSISRC
jgi:hypothetical protein